MKLAIIGTGKIVQEALYAIDSLRSIDTRAIFGRPHSREKARSLADQYRITCVHDPEYLRQLENAVQAMLRLADKTKTRSYIYNTSNKIRIKFNKQ